MEILKYLCIAPILLLFSCVKQPDIKPKTGVEVTDDVILVLNEGLIDQNDVSITRYHLDKDTVEHNVFYGVNERKLGDTGNDIELYGGKVYVAVHSSSTVEVFDAKSLESLAQILLVRQNRPSMPRSLAFWKDKALVTNYDGTVTVIDTTSLQVEENIEVGRNPEGIAVYGDSAFVMNSGGLDFPNYDTTLSVIDLQSMQEVTKYTVGENGSDIVANSVGELILITRGNHDDVVSDVKILDRKTGDFESLGVRGTSLALAGNDCWVASFDYNTLKSSIVKFDMTTHVVDYETGIDASDIETLYGISINEEREEVYLFDAEGFMSFGVCRIYSLTGDFKNSFDTKMLPNGGVVLRHGG